MFSGDEKKIRFEFSGLSVQAILDKMPTARIIEVNEAATGFVFYDSIYCIIHDRKASITD